MSGAEALASMSSGSKRVVPTADDDVLREAEILANSLAGSNGPKSEAPDNGPKALRTSVTRVSHYGGVAAVALEAKHEHEVSELIRHACPNKPDNAARPKQKHNALSGNRSACPATTLEKGSSTFRPPLK